MSILLARRLLPRRRFAGAILGGLAASLATRRRAAAQNPVFQSQTRIVAVAIVARDSDGAPAMDLTMDDLRVFDNGAEQKILSFDKLWDPPRTADGLPIGLPPKRPTIIVLNTLYGSGLRRFELRDGVAEMLRTLPQTVDRIEIFALGDELKLVHAFSPFTYTLRTAMLEFEGTPSTIPAANVPMWIIKTLSNLAYDLKNIRGEKNLLWVGGLPVDAPGRGGDGSRGAEYYQDMARAMQQLSDARVMFYPIQPDLMKPFELDDFAQLTGGKVYWEDKDLAGLLRDAIDDSRDGYMLTYTPSNYQEDGSAHEVKLKTERKGIELRFRPGYNADLVKK